MPTYEYRCPSCGHEFEDFQPMSAEPVRVCPACGKETQRLISGGIGLIFKGSGFYITDYKKKSGSPGDGDSSGKTESKPEGKSESKSDSRADSKSESKPKAASKSEPKAESKSGSESDPKPKASTSS